MQNFKYCLTAIYPAQCLQGNCISRGIIWTKDLMKTRHEFIKRLKLTWPTMYSRNWLTKNIEKVW